MKRWTILLATCLFAHLSAWTNCFVNTDVELGVGYRQDNLEWSISCPPNADLLSELSWKELRIGYLALRAQTTLPNWFHLRAEVDYGRIWDGKARDSDFINVDNKCFEFSRSSSEAGKGEVFDATIGLGYPFTLLCDTLRIIPLIGYSYNSQHLRLFNSCQHFLFGCNQCGEILEIVDARNHPIDGVHCNYRPEWHGPWLGIDFGYDYCEYTFLGSFEYHWATYNASGHWNKRCEFVDDFKQRSDAHGVVVMAGVNYDFNDCLNFGIRGNYTYYKGQSGNDITKIDKAKIGFSDSALECFPDIIKVTTPFDGATWHSFRIEGTIAYKF